LVPIKKDVLMDRDLGVICKKVVFKNHGKERNYCERNFRQGRRR
jgi:hypothetical protein